MTNAEIVRSLPDLRALVVGDICLDRWCTYDPALADPSRETGIDRIAVTSVERTPGGGGTVANNLAAFGLASVAVLGVAGDDGHGSELAQALDANGILANSLLRSPLVSTFTYTKLINGQTGIEDKARVDFIDAHPLSASLDRQLAERLREMHGSFDLILIADQAETSFGGVVTESLRRVLAQIAADCPNKVLWADSRLRCELFRGLTMKVNREEADNACRRAFETVRHDRLRALMEAPHLFVTDGPNGTLIYGPEKTVHVPVRRIECPVDICGAGDSFSAGAACALAVGAGAEEAARFGNTAASVTVMKRGTGTASPEELLIAGVST